MFSGVGTPASNLYFKGAWMVDPRCKVNFVEYFFNKIFSLVEAIERVDNVLGTLCSLYDEYK